MTKQFGKIWEKIYYKFGKKFKKMENLAKFRNHKFGGKVFFFKLNPYLGEEEG